MTTNPFLSKILFMHQKFIKEEIPFSKEEKKFRVICMKEEIQEYEDSNIKTDELDALVDLVVFALGTVERQGMLNVFEEAFDKVMTANMGKETGTNQKRGDFNLDLIKPETWIAPYLKDLVGEE